MKVDFGEWISLFRDFHSFSLNQSIDLKLDMLLN